MNAFRETDSIEKIQKVDRPQVREADAPRLSSNTEFRDKPSSESADVYGEVFKNFGLSADGVEKKEYDVKSSGEVKEYSNYLEKVENGKYCDKNTGKTFDSIEDWENHQTTVAKRFESTAQYYEKKAKKEWARFKNADNNDLSDSEKWEHYHQSQRCYTKAGEFKNKAQTKWEMLGATKEVSS